jgi:hypothetical protein
VVADHTKWGTIGISSVGKLHEAETIITDTGLDQAARGQIAAAVHRLILVDAVTGERWTFEDATDVDPVSHDHVGASS